MHLKFTLLFTSRSPVLRAPLAESSRALSECVREVVGKLRILAVLSAVLTGAVAQTTIEVTDDVLVKDVLRLGINAPCPEWKRHAENFEGTMYRAVISGPFMDATGIASWWSFPQEMVGADFVVLSGAAKGQKGKIKAIERPRTEYTQGQGSFVTFDKPLTASHGKGSVAILVERNAITEGYAVADEKKQGRYALQKGDVPPGSYGVNALKLLGAKGTGAYGVSLRSTNVNRVSFWAKAVGAAATLKIQISGAPTPDLTVVQEWKRYEAVGSPASARGAGGVDFNVTGMDVLIDDVELWTDAPSKYPQCHVTDSFVDTVKKLRPGIVRELQMGGNTVHNLINPAVRSHLHSANFSAPGRKAGYGLAGGESTVAFYSLCEAVGAAPWQCLPGTMNAEEMRQFIEFIAAPADVGLGRERAAQGHPEPYTKKFKRIYIEIGNEAWNPVFGLGGFNGPDFWKELFAVAKQSPYYQPNIFLVAGSQQQLTSLTRQILTNAPTADAAAIATYVCHELPPEWMTGLDTADERFRWLFGFTVRSVADPISGYVKKQTETARELGKEMTIYEHNYHMTKPTEEKGGVPYKDRNTLMVSIGGGVNIVNHMLLALRDADVRAQCFFTLRQSSYAGVRLWGALSSMSSEHPRPAFYGLQICNEVIGGDLVATRHGGDNPTFSATGVFLENKRTGKHTTVDGVPVLYSYAFKEGARRGLILASLDTGKPREIELKIPGKVAGQAKRWTLMADKITDNNEGDLTGPAPQVLPPREETFTLSSGTRLQLPPHSLTAIEWRTE